MRKTIDLNADLGETDGDLALLETVTSANIACGGHAGDEASMARALDAARGSGVTVGAHPSYPDRPGFGRRELGLPPPEIADAVRFQVSALQRLAREHGCQVAYVKPHGALYHRLMADRELAHLLLESVADLGVLGILAAPGSVLLEAARGRGLRVAAEAFCDRAYGPDARLVSRDDPAAVLDDPDAAVRQAVALASGDNLRAVDGSLVRIEASSLCVHGDTPGALNLARRVRAALAAAGVELRPIQW